MFFSLKSLIERQLNSLGQALFEAQPLAGGPNSIAPYQAGRTWSLSFGHLQNGGDRHLSMSGAVEISEAAEESGAFSLEKVPQSLSDAARQGFENFLQEIGVPQAADTQFPESNPLTLQRIDWSQEIQQSTLDDLSRSSARQAKCEALSQNAKTNRLTQLLFLALRSGNISLAMLLFSHLEASTANDVTRCLMEKLQKMQDNKRKLAQDIQNQKDDAQGSKNLQKIKFEMEQVNDDISVLQTFIKDVAQNKQSALEMANAFLSKEHETTMAIVRSFGR